ncbi:S8 family serine peptidase [Pusillimonas sp.]|uniref:S8 family serine peptidase n=1 Tax=Pusillimonas sp. TaxID=3040095 RepID=UPI0037C720B0
MNKNTLRFSLLLLTTATLSACGNSGSSDTTAACTETGAYACQTGETEPLYTFQWALNYADSYFNDFPETFNGGLDLNVEPAHRRGIKGQGVNVLVLDSGADLHNEDLLPNADFSMSWNFVSSTDDPYPIPSDPDEAHGTAAAGVIAAAQNGKGIMGIAPLANLGAANYLQGQMYFVEAYGGAAWSSKAHVFNASYGSDEDAESYEAPGTLGQTLAIRGMKKLRDGKGAAFFQAAGNSFSSGLCGKGSNLFNCVNPSNDYSMLESNVIAVAALNAKGSASSYSSAGPVVWVTGMGGEFGGDGNYGEGPGDDPVQDGPTIYSTDLSNCMKGYSRTDAQAPPFKRGQTARDGKPDNANCDYTYMNGTSAATPTISGVAALILSANPELTWRDLRDILRLSARKVDAGYINDTPQGGNMRYGSLYDLAANKPIDQLGTAADIREGATAYPMTLGWQTNAAGHQHSDWYGFGVPDTEKAVALALEYKANPGLSRAQDVQMPQFRPMAYWHLNTAPDADELEELGSIVPRDGEPFPYKKVSSLGTFAWDKDQIVDQLQIRLSGEEVCLGSFGIAAKSPSKTVSLLKLPNDHFKADGLDVFESYTLGSYTFYGEPAQGNWELFIIASNPDIGITVEETDENDEIIERPSVPCLSTDEHGVDRDFYFFVEARIVAQ